ncbi:hypothetical protein [Bacillus sp. Marseille-P3661]|uniref:hypothetical protein n=1 Tax=Bacillus sp. Marseille-P3661 TaxID=1936234 RepID=UPI000C81664B|nr:hypothetical protein [Bacillus sp. Marseille-P3661]
MFRVGASIILGLILFLFEAYIVMKLKNHNAAYLGDINQFISLWAVNFFFVYTILTDVKNSWESRRSVQN